MVGNMEKVVSLLEKGLDPNFQDDRTGGKIYQFFFLSSVGRFGKISFPLDFLMSTTRSNCTSDEVIMCQTFSRTVIRLPINSCFVMVNVGIIPLKQAADQILSIRSISSQFL